MEAHAHIPHLREILIFLVAAGLAVPLLQRRMSSVLGYLVLGAIIGPFGLGLLAEEFPILQMVVITELDGVRALAELGIVFLLFTIGLELSFERVWGMRRLVFGLGSAQIVVTACVIALIAFAWGNSPTAALVLGACLALSSTAIVTQLLVERYGNGPRLRLDWRGGCPPVMME
ncbi:MAG: cation:proton antiporter [Croceibacterium sp.]